MHSLSKYKNSKNHSGIKCKALLPIWSFNLTSAQWANSSQPSYPFQNDEVATLVEIRDSRTPESQYDDILNTLVSKSHTHKRIQIFSPLLFTVEMAQSMEHAEVATELLTFLRGSITTQMFGLQNFDEPLPVQLKFLREGGEPAVLFISLDGGLAQPAWPLPEMWARRADYNSPERGTVLYCGSWSV